MEEPAVQTSATVLLAEDESALRDFFAKVLERAGFRILAAVDGAHALSISQGYFGRIDLLLTDINMPGLNGCDLALQMASQRPETKILFMTGLLQPELQPVVARFGGHLLYKPFRADELVKEMRTMMGVGKA